MIRFDSELRELNEAMTKMGSLCEEAIALSASALISGKKELAQEVEGLEREIDAMENDIESMCLQLLLRRQPVARDLRQISAALKLVTDMERIGDHAVNIAEWVIFCITGLHHGVDAI